MVKVRSEQELELMRKSGQISAKALKKVIESVRVGITGIELDQIATEEIKKQGGQLAFTSVPGYKWASCITVNEQIVHGIPSNQVFKEGDLVSIDLGTIYQGWFSDSAWSVLVREQGTGDREQSEKIKFLKIGEEALWKGIEMAVDGNRVGDIGSAIQKEVEGAGFSIVRSLVGHGVGKELHEEPEVPGYGRANKGLLLKSGMTLAIEVIYTMGRPEVVLENDGWTVSAADGSLSGLFEMTIVVGKKKAEVLTGW